MAPSVEGAGACWEAQVQDPTDWAGRHPSMLMCENILLTPKKNGKSNHRLLRSKQRAESIQETDSHSSTPEPLHKDERNPDLSANRCVKR